MARKKFSSSELRQLASLVADDKVITLDLEARTGKRNGVYVEYKAAKEPLGNNASSYKLASSTIMRLAKSIDADTGEKPSGSIRKAKRNGLYLINISIPNQEEPNGKES